MGVAHVGLVHCDPCECKVKGFRAVSSIERNVSNRRHLQGVRHLDAKLYIKPSPDFLPKPIPPESLGSFPRLRIQKALYGLKQVGRMWYQHLKEFLTSHEFLTDHTLPCIFIYRNQKEFVIVAAYVDDLNLIGTKLAITHAKTLLTEKFQMKFLGPTTLCLGLQVKHLKDGSLFLHQTAYTQRILKRFSMDQAQPLSAPFMGCNKTNDDPYFLCEEEEQELDKPRYLAAVGALLYLATYTQPDISFAVSVLSRHSQKSTSRHWAGVKHLFRYLRGTEDLRLHYTEDQTPRLIGYADTGYKSDVRTGKSQTGYVFIKNNAPILWKSVKQTITATSTNHSELLAFHEATRELVWL